MKGLVKGIVLVLIALMAGIQIARPERVSESGDPLETFRSEGDDVEALATLERSCLDCHSRSTDWPWYTNVAPVSWWIADHVQHAQGHLNFSDWETYPSRKKQELLEEICEEITKKAMPFDSYTWIHRDAILSEDEIEELCQWTRMESDRLADRPTTANDDES